MISDITDAWTEVKIKKPLYEYCLTYPLTDKSVKNTTSFRIVER